jgi:hypothetical protein
VQWEDAPKSIHNKRSLRFPSMLRCAAWTLVAVACFRARAGAAGPPQAITAGGYHTCALQADGTVTCWGFNDQGQAPQVTIGPAELPVGAVGVAYSTTITATGGTAPYAFDVVTGTLPAGLSLSAGGVLSGTPPAGGMYPITVRAVDAFTVPFSARRDYTVTVREALDVGDDHTCGIAADGAVVCWGDDDDGQSTPPAGVFQQVSGGNSHTCGLRVDGTVACWGSNGLGESTPRAGTFSQVSVVGVARSGCARMTRWRAGEATLMASLRRRPGSSGW